MHGDGQTCQNSKMKNKRTRPTNRLLFYITVQIMTVITTRFHEISGDNKCSLIAVTNSVYENKLLLKKRLNSNVKR